MKNKIITSIKTAVMPYLMCTGAALLFNACEPEPVKEAPLELDLNARAVNKAAMADLPHKEIAQLRAAIAPLHKFEAAYAAGYQVEVTGYVSQMGYHYLNPSLLDGTFEIDKPEVLLFVTGPNGKLRFVGVEYAVPIADMQNPQPAPEGFTGDHDQWVINTDFNLWVLHAWVGEHNPHGIFASHNPRIP